MLERIEQSWGRDPIGYRKGELAGPDGVAATAVVLVGGPAFLIGARFVGDLGLSIVQVLLVAPLAAILGGLVIGTSARIAATTGTHATWLLRPPFGLAGSRVVSAIRLLAVALWAIIGLQFVADWGTGAVQAAGLADGGWAGPTAVALVVVLGVVMLVSGLVPAVRIVMRRPLFWSSVVLLAIVAWRMAEVGTVTSTDTGSFWPAVQEATEMAVVFVPFIQAVARRLKDDDEAQTSFGVGYAIPATLMFLSGALFGGLVGTVPTDLAVLAVGGAGGIFAIAWILIAEVDQAFAAFVAGGAEGAGISTRVPEWLPGTIVMVAVVGVGAFGPRVNVALASLITALAFPAALISIVDFYVAHKGYYSQSEVLGAVGESRIVNVVGMGCWLVVVILGQVIDPVGPDQWLSTMPDITFADGLPWRLLMAILGAAGYLVLWRWQEGRVGRVHELRGVDRQVTNRM